MVQHWTATTYLHLPRCSQVPQLRRQLPVRYQPQRHPLYRQLSLLQYLLQRLLHLWLQVSHQRRQHLQPQHLAGQLGWGAGLGPAAMRRQLAIGAAAVLGRRLTFRAKAPLTAIGVRGHGLALPGASPVTRWKASAPKSNR